MRARTLILSAVAVGVCGLLGFLKFGGSDTDTATTTVAPPPRVEARPGRVDTARPSGPTTASAPKDDRVGTVNAPDDPDEAINAPVDPTPATHEEPLTEAERDPRMKRAVQMLDEAITRTEARLAGAEEAGDAAAANQARVRIAKLKEVRELRARELEVTQ